MIISKKSNVNRVFENLLKDVKLMQNKVLKVSCCYLPPFLIELSKNPEGRQNLLSPTPLSPMGRVLTGAHVELLTRATLDGANSAPCPIFSIAQKRRQISTQNLSIFPSFNLTFATNISEKSVHNFFWKMAFY